MKRRIPLAVFCLIVGACTMTQAQTKTTRAPSDPPDAHPQYFPKGVFSNDLQESDFVARWYSKHLRAMAEPSLLIAARDKAVIDYRFLWLRTFDHPIAIRLAIQPDGTASLTGKVTSGHGGYEPGRVSQSESLEVSKAGVQRFNDFLQLASFWSLRTNEDTGGNDGAQWVLEGVKNGSYHVVDRWTPRGGDYRNLCLYLLELSRIKVDPKKIY